MKNIKQFEAFKGKEIDAINKFIKNKKGSKELIDLLAKISKEIDRPMSAFNGLYVSAIKAKTIIGDNLIKIFFNSKGDIVILTKTNNNKDYYSDYLSTFLNKRGFLSDAQLSKLSKFINGKIISIKNYSELSNDQEVVVQLKYNKYALLGIVYKEKLDNGVEDYFIMCNDSNSKDYIPYMISPNEADKKLIANYKTRYVRISRDNHKIDTYTYIGKIIEDNSKTLDQNFDHTTNSTKILIENNVGVDNRFRKIKWRDEILNKIEDSDFALVLDINKIIESSKPLSDIKVNRENIKKDILPRIDDEFYKNLNKEKYNRKLNKSTQIEKDYKRIILSEIMAYIKKIAIDSYNYEFNSIDILVNLFRNYDDDIIDTSELLEKLYQYDVNAFKKIVYNSNVRFDKYLNNKK